MEALMTVEEAARPAQTNPHMLEAIAQASERCTIVASEDICDERGNKLWARGQPVSRSLQQRLLERRLRQPLEASLQAEDGVGTARLIESMDAFLASADVLADAVKPHAQALRGQLQKLPLHSVAQLLLTTVQATKPAVYEHAVRTMVLAGAMQASVRASGDDIALALLGGLLHDLGEIYIAPQYVDNGQPLDAAGYRHIVVHPRVGEMLLRTQTDYPPALARAVAEHHERLDGSGYPGQRAARELSPLGRLLAVVETTLGIASGGVAPCMRASFGLRVVPGEFDETWVGFISAAATRAQEDLAVANLDETGAGLQQVDTRLQHAQQRAQTLAAGPDCSPAVRKVGERAVHALSRLRAGWNAIGLWAGVDAAATPESRFERYMARQELRFRMRAVRRDSLWPESNLSEADALQLEPLWACLTES